MRCAKSVYTTYSKDELRFLKFPDPDICGQWPKTEMACTYHRANLSHSFTHSLKQSILNYEKWEMQQYYGVYMYYYMCLNEGNPSNVFYTVFVHQTERTCLLAFVGVTETSQACVSISVACCILNTVYL